MGPEDHAHVFRNNGDYSKYLPFQVSHDLFQIESVMNSLTRSKILSLNGHCPVIFLAARFCMYIAVTAHEVLICWARFISHPSNEIQISGSNARRYTQHSKHVESDFHAAPRVRSVYSATYR